MFQKDYVNFSSLRKFLLTKIGIRDDKRRFKEFCEIDFSLCIIKVIFVKD